MPDPLFRPFWVCVHGDAPRCFRAHHADVTDGHLTLVNQAARDDDSVVARFPLETIIFWWEGSAQTSRPAAPQR
jgi:hypothetical protein